MKTTYNQTTRPAKPTITMDSPSYGFAENQQNGFKTLFVWEALSGLEVGLAARGAMPRGCTVQLNGFINKRYVEGSMPNRIVKPMGSGMLAFFELEQAQFVKSSSPFGPTDQFEASAVFLGSYKPRDLIEINASTTPQAAQEALQSHPIWTASYGELCTRFSNNDTVFTALKAKRESKKPLKLWQEKGESLWESFRSMYSMRG